MVTWEWNSAFMQATIIPCKGMALVLLRKLQFPHIWIDTTTHQHRFSFTAFSFCSCYSFVLFLSRQLPLPHQTSPFFQKAIVFFMKELAILEEKYFICICSDILPYQSCFLPSLLSVRWHHQHYVIARDACDPAASLHCGQERGALWAM